MKLNFKYCECGCKGWEASLKGLDYWIYWNLKKTYTVRTGHSYNGQLIKNCSSFKEAEKIANQHWKDSP